MNRPSVTQAVILAGGRGKRLRPLSDNVPKPMAQINGAPFLDYLIYSLVLAGIENIVILLGYKGEVIASRYKNIIKINIDYSYGSLNDQTGRRLLNAYDQLDDHFILLYGDNYWSIELKKMWLNFIQSGASVSTTVFSNKFGTGEYGYENNVVVGSDGFVKKYDKKRETKEANGVDIGYFIVKKKIINPYLKDNVSFEIDILPEVIQNKELTAFITDNKYYYITNKDTLKSFETAAKDNNFTPLPGSYFKNL